MGRMIIVLDVSDDEADEIGDLLAGSAANYVAYGVREALQDVRHQFPHAERRQIGVRSQESAAFGGEPAALAKMGD